MEIKAGGLTDVGILRDHNEDSYFINEEYSLFMVADGMGGHVAGGRASQMAVAVVEQAMVEGLKELDRKGGETPAKDPAQTDVEGAAPAEAAAKPAPARPTGTLIMGAIMPDAVKVAPPQQDPVLAILVKSIQKASAEILNESKAHTQYSGMGTTTTCMLIRNGIGYFGHVGDSRLYRVRQGHIEQVSEDHSLVNEHVKAGIIDQHEARVSQFKNIITRSVGFDPNVAVDAARIDIKPGDRFLICSDGLSNLVTDQEICDIVSNQDMDTALKFHINLANSRGGDDNITVIIIEVN